MQFAIWQNWLELMSRLTGELHAANVPLLAGSDAGGPPGVLPGSSLHEELRLLVQAGLTPYEALRTATVNPAVYLDGAKEFGTVAPGFRADLVLLASNPLEDIGHIDTRVGVMKRGRWFSADELEAALEQLAEERQ
jgi:imidazolonepropionase-like amidohydrolase